MTKSSTRTSNKPKTKEEIDNLMKRANEFLNEQLKDPKLAAKFGFTKNSKADADSSGILGDENQNSGYGMPSVEYEDIPADINSYGKQEYMDMVMASQRISLIDSEMRKLSRLNAGAVPRTYEIARRKFAEWLGKKPMTLDDLFEESKNNMTRLEELMHRQISHSDGILRYLQENLHVRYDGQANAVHAMLKAKSDLDAVDVLIAELGKKIRRDSTEYEPDNVERKKRLCDLKVQRTMIRGKGVGSAAMYSFTKRDEGILDFYVRSTSESNTLLKAAYQGMHYSKELAPIAYLNYRAQIEQGHISAEAYAQLGMAGTMIRFVHAFVPQALASLRAMQNNPLYKTVEEIISHDSSGPSTGSAGGKRGRGSGYDNFNRMNDIK